MIMELKPCEPTEPAWIRYDQQRPLEGVYQWRLPSLVLTGLNVIFIADMRMRGAGHERVLSPQFDHWNGYSVSVPPKTEWRPTSVVRDRRECDCTHIEIEGLEFAPCIYCNKVPTLEANERVGGGLTVLAEPNRFNSWRLKCCVWGSTPEYSDPREIEKVRLEAFKRAAWNTRASQWQPIETAPKDGTQLLLWSKGQIDVGYWSTSLWVNQGGAWIIYEDRSDTIQLRPTHWQPLPPPPTKG